MISNQQEYQNAYTGACLQKGYILGCVSAEYREGLLKEAARAIQSFETLVTNMTAYELANNITRIPLPSIEL